MAHKGSTHYIGGRASSDIFGSGAGKIFSVQTRIIIKYQTLWKGENPAFLEGLSWNGCVNKGEHIREIPVTIRRRFLEKRKSKKVGGGPI